LGRWILPTRYFAISINWRFPNRQKSKVIFLFTDVKWFEYFIRSLDKTTAMIWAAAAGDLQVNYILY
jgi:hypothetical protein